MYDLMDDRCYMILVYYLDLREMMILKQDNISVGCMRDNRSRQYILCQYNKLNYILNRLNRLIII